MNPYQKFRTKSSSGRTGPGGSQPGIPIEIIPVKKGEQTKPKPLMIACRELPDFNTGSLDDVRRAFLSAVPCVLRQAWLEHEEDDFTSAVVKTGWRNTSLLVFAELMDSDIFSRATQFNQRLWELGDTFEIFLQPVGQEDYVEFQVAPGNQQLQLRNMDASAFMRAQDTGSIKSALIHDKAFHSNTWVWPRERQWFVFAEIPAASVRDNKSRLLPGDQWRFSFSRYDYIRGRKEPVISSTSPHIEANFHRQQEWGTIRFQP
jgi:hypothetical protein